MIGYNSAPRIQLVMLRGCVRSVSLLTDFRRVRFSALHSAIAVTSDRYRDIIANRSLPCALRDGKILFLAYV